MTDQPEPLPAVPESAPRGRVIVGPLPKTIERPGQGVVSIGAGGLPECSRHGAMNRVSGDRDWWRCLECNIGVECAPRPVPETAHGHKWVLLDSPALRCACGALTLPDGDPPAPPAEPVEEAQRLDFGTTPENEAAYDALLSAERPRCDGCGGFEDDDMHQQQATGDIDGTTHAFIPPVEDEGARPLGELWDAYNDLVVGALQFGIVTTDAELDAARESIEAAIRKEATAALLADEKLLHDTFGCARAEAAEGALRDVLAVIDHAYKLDFTNGVTDPTGSIDEGDVRSWEIINRARALTAESVTPGAEG